MKNKYDSQQLIMTQAKTSLRAQNHPPNMTYFTGNSLKFEWEGLKI